MAKVKSRNLIGEQFGRLVVLERVENGKHGHPRWLARCECGELTTVLGYNLHSGRSNSCGCLSRERTSETHATHGMSDTAVYRIWRDMVRRCTDPNRASWKHYGGRGISVCQSWMTFENFYADMGTPPPGASIDRIDNDNNYCPNNCRWATQAEQSRNRSDNTRVYWRGQSRILSDVADELGFGRGTIRTRLRLGWSVQEALATPVGQRRQAS